MLKQNSIDIGIMCYLINEAVLVGEGIWSVTVYHIWSFLLQNSVLKLLGSKHFRFCLQSYVDWPLVSVSASLICSSHPNILYTPLTITVLLYKQIAKPQMATAMEVSNTSDTSSDLKPQVIYRCKKCRRIVASAEQVVPHQRGGGQKCFKWKKRSDDDTEPECSSIFVEPMKWMQTC